MTTLDVRGRFFTVRFRHTRNLSHALNVQAITTCVIITEKSDGPGGLEFESTEIDFVAIGNAICWRSDNFSRRFGRRKAFANALDHCALLRPYALDLFAAYLAADPDPPRRLPVQLSHALQRARWEAGWEKRKEREVRKAERAIGVRS
jgi:hypothetical protein